ncbi:Hint domain-containing protein [Pseudaestuariivita sp.]|uniref:Hint domain-containing protein n=1 Tax=Pseudaestuariivita sp. TaxID=2211669 RepID=UPI004058BD45
MRKYEVASLLPNLSVKTSHHIAPATPLFTDTASAFAHGTLIDTISGPVAVEDLIPGDHVEVQGGDPAAILWIGSTMMAPNRPDLDGALSQLVRIMPDTFGLARPMRNLLLGPGARVLQPQHGAEGAALVNIRDTMDGMSVIEVTPPSPVRLYHIATKRHAVIHADGIAVETYHPGRFNGEGLGINTRSLFLSMFPHITGFADFGSLAYPRKLGEDDLHAA